MELWWNSLTTTLQVFYAIALSTSAIMVLQLLTAIIGLDGDADTDFDVGDDVNDAGMHILSVRSVIAFFTGFGWGGVVALRHGYSLAASIALALLCGGVLMAAVFFLMRALFSMRYSGTIDYRNAVGKVGNAYISVPADMGGAGQVEVLVQGRLKVVRAFTHSPAAISTRSPIRVVDVLDPQTLIVEPLTPARAQSPAEASSPPSQTAED